jgi:hypothetical protein
MVHKYIRLHNEILLQSYESAVGPEHPRYEDLVEDFALGLLRNQTKLWEELGLSDEDEQRSFIAPLMDSLERNSADYGDQQILLTGRFGEFKKLVRDAMRIALVK